MEVSASRLSSQVPIWEPSAATVFPSPQLPVTPDAGDVELVEGVDDIDRRGVDFAGGGVLVARQAQLVHADLAPHVRGDLGGANRVPWEKAVST